MKVHTEPESAVSSLRRGDGACVGVGHAWEVENRCGSFAERMVELVREGTHDQRREGAVIAEQRTQAPGQGANPVTHGYAGQHLLQTRCRQPADKSPQRKYSSNSRTTNFGRPPCSARSSSTSGQWAWTAW